jgi:hypothetical protein
MFQKALLFLEMSASASVFLTGRSAIVCQVDVTKLNPALCLKLRISYGK